MEIKISRRQVMGGIGGLGLAAALGSSGLANGQEGLSLTEASNLFDTNALPATRRDAFGQQRYCHRRHGRLERLVAWATSAEPASHPNLTIWLPPEFMVVGGGAQVIGWTAGNLLTASHPIVGGALDGWHAAAKDHSVVDPARITVWAIGMRGT